MMSKYASLHELSTTLALSDMYDILEVIAVEAYNRDLVEQQRRRKRQAELERQPWR